MTLAIPRLAFRQHSPRRRLCRRSPTLTARNISSMRAKPMKLLGLNLTIPFAVRSGGCCFRLSLFRLSFSLACAAKPLEAELRAFEAARHRCFGPIPCPQTSRFQPIFQVLFCRGPMPCDHGPVQVPQSRPLATRARGIPGRSVLTQADARPACENSSPTAAAWPSPSSTTSAPADLSKRGIVAAIAR